jgi:hypothetical protein
MHVGNPACTPPPMSTSITHPTTATCCSSPTPAAGAAIHSLHTLQLHQLFRQNPCSTPRGSMCSLAASGARAGSAAALGAATLKAEQGVKSFPGSRHLRQGNACGVGDTWKLPSQRVLGVVLDKAALGAVQVDHPPYSTLSCQPFPLPIPGPLPHRHTQKNSLGAAA